MSKLITSIAMSFLVGLLACNGGSSSNSTVTPGQSVPFSVGTYSLTLPVDKSSSSGTVGTRTITVTRGAGFTSSITLTVGTLPSGVKASFDQSVITGNTAELSIEAGYPDPSDPSFKTKLIPATGTYNIPIIATSGDQQATGTLTLTVNSALQDFSVAFFSGSGSNISLDSTTVFILHPGTDLVEPVLAYVSTGTYADQPVALSVEGLDAGLTATFDARSVSLNYTSHTLTLHADSAITPGIYAFRVKAVHANGQARYLPVTVNCSTAPFWIQPIQAVTVQQGYSVTFPIQLGRNDTFYSSTPAYFGTTDLSVLSSPANLTVTFADPNPTGSSTASITINATSATPGSQTVTLRASRDGQNSDLSLPITITDINSTTPTLWVPRVEWGQTILSPEVSLVPGKPALLRVHLLADRSAVTTPTVTARIENGSGGLVDTLTFAAPSLVPTATEESDLGSTCTVDVPPADIQPGMQVLIQASGTTLQTLLPAVENTGYDFPLTIVPIVHKSTAPVLPTDVEITTQLEAFWPVHGVNITRRAPYTTSTVIPTPPDANSTATDHSGDGWNELLDEIASLRMIDGSSNSYYGLFNLGLPSSFRGSSTVGLHFTGLGAGLGIDKTTADTDFGSGAELLTMVHELGHGFHLNHAPLGGAADPMLNYPYSGSLIGSWGYDPATASLYEPSICYDIMGYTSAPQWVSDFCYLSAQGFIRELVLSGTSIPLPLVAQDAASDQLVVSGWQGPDGKIHLRPLVRTTCTPVQPKAGALELTLESPAGSRHVSFQAEQVEDLPPGYRHFAFTVPAQESLSALEILSNQQTLLRRETPRSISSRSVALASAIQARALVAVERDRVLHLRWDASVHPYVTVVHEGARRTTLAMHLSGGSVDLSLEGLPAGGQFLIHFSDGLNTLHYRVARGLEP